MSEMIERVRSAIVAEHNRQMQQGRLGQKIDTAAMARAGIEAMREPTEAMHAAGVNAVTYDRAWPAMIDAALQD